MAKKTIVDFLVELDSNSKLMDAYKKKATFERILSVLKLMIITLR